MRLFGQVGEFYRINRCAVKKIVPRYIRSIRELRRCCLWCVSVCKIASTAGVITAVFMLVFIIEIVMMAGADSIIAIRFAVAKRNLACMRVTSVMNMIQDQSGSKPSRNIPYHHGGGDKSDDFLSI